MFRSRFSVGREMDDLGRNQRSDWLGIRRRCQQFRDSLFLHRDSPLGTVSVSKQNLTKVG